MLYLGSNSRSHRHHHYDPPPVLMYRFTVDKDTSRASAIDACVCPAALSATAFRIRVSSLSDCLSKEKLQNCSGFAFMSFSVRQKISF